MNDTNIADDYDDFNIETLERAAEDVTDRNSAGLDQTRATQRAIRRCIAVITDVRRDSGSLTGRTLDDHLAQLLEIKGNLSRTEGELVDADPHSRF